MKNLIFIGFLLCVAMASFAQLPNLTAMEYYIDVDPGHGNGEDLSITPGQTLDINVPIPTTGLTAGFHVLTLRAMDENGVWSHYESRPFYIARSTSESRENIIAMEYFFDVDPGQGNGESITIATATDIDQIEMMPISSLTDGFHTLSVRAQSASGTWSMVEQRTFYIAVSTNESRENITAMEYFFNTDPGQGNGEALTITADPDIDQVEIIPISSLPNGFHTLSIRAQSASGTWSMTEQRSFYIALSTNESREDIVAMEYFFDTDPGQGNGEAIGITADPDIDQVEIIPISSLANGFHTLSVRAQSASGTWSMTEQRTFYIALSTNESRENIIAMEYFFDTDPGQGNGEAIGITADPDIDQVEIIPISSLPNGFHTLSVRAQSASGTWSMTEQLTFYIALSTNEGREDIIAMEYFFDTDPGQGNGETISISTAPDVDQVEMIPTSSLTKGFHILSVRAQSASGTWSMIESRAFYITPSVFGVANELTQIEYYIDEDPGYGNGTEITATGASADLIHEVSTIGLEAGMHSITVRAQNEKGIWGQIESEPFYVDKTRAIQRMDYAFDTDPGAGQGTLLAIDQPMGTIALDLVLPNPGLSLGEHDLIARVQDGIELWSDPETTGFTICEGALADFSIGDITCASTAVEFTDLTTNAVDGDVYSWDFDNDGVVDDATAGHTTFTYAEAGTYTIKLTVDRLGCASSKIKEITIHTRPTVTAQASVTDICLGDEVTLTGSGADTYAWDHEVEDDTPFAPEATETYTVTGTDENGCYSSATAEVIVNAVETPQISVVEELGIHGTIITSNSESGNQWFEGGEPIEGATDQTLEVLKPTSVTLQVTVDGCFSEMTDAFGVFVLEASGNLSDSKIFTWPNPVEDRLYFRAPSNASETLTYHVFNSLGQLVEQNSWQLRPQSTAPAIDVDRLVPGIYLLLIEGQESVMSGRFVKK